MLLALFARPNSVQYRHTLQYSNLILGTSMCIVDESAVAIQAPHMGTLGQLASVVISNRLRSVARTAVPTPGHIQIEIIRMINFKDDKLLKYSGGRQQAYVGL